MRVFLLLTLSLFTSCAVPLTSVWILSSWKWRATPSRLVLARFGLIIIGLRQLLLVVHLLLLNLRFNRVRETPQIIDSFSSRRHLLLVFLLELVQVAVVVLRRLQRLWRLQWLRLLQRLLLLNWAIWLDRRVLAWVIEGVDHVLDLGSLVELRTVTRLVLLFNVCFWLWRLTLNVIRLHQVLTRVPFVRVGAIIVLFHVDLVLLRLFRRLFGLGRLVILSLAEFRLDDLLRHELLHLLRTAHFA